MRSVSSKLYDKNYYLQVCLGSDEFKKSKGKLIHPRLQKLLQTIPLPPSAKILDVGCGRGDISLYLAQHAEKVIGIDYSQDAIDLAQSIKKKSSPPLKKKIEFKRMNIKKLSFSSNSFDVVICIDVLEHLYKEEAEQAMQEISRVLKKGGILFLHTGTNKLLYDIIYPLYVLPMNRLLTTIDQIIKKKKYASLPSDPRTQEEKLQHVNEPTYFYLKNLLHKYNFQGKIKTEIGLLKEVTGWRSRIYNALIAWYPISKFFPLNILFSWVFIGNFKNNKQ